jgi:ABC-2 type transport system ATP-binding protein
MLEGRHLRKRYSGIPAVDDVSFIARAGEVTGYLGANGSGKSTTMKMATGLIDPTSGEILFEALRAGLLSAALRAVPLLPEDWFPRRSQNET